MVLPRVLRRLFLYFVRGGDLPASVWDTRYLEHVAVRRSVNGGLVHVCFSVTPGMAVSMERIKVNGCTAFLNKVKRKFVNNSGSN